MIFLFYLAMRNFYYCYFSAFNFYSRIFLYFSFYSLNCYSFCLIFSLHLLKYLIASSLIIVLAKILLSNLLLRASLVRVLLILYFLNIFCILVAISFLTLKKL